jgi:hypothetical protein
MQHSFVWCRNCDILQSRLEMSLTDLLGKEGIRHGINEKSNIITYYKYVEGRLTGLVIRFIGNAI